MVEVNKCNCWYFINFLNLPERNYMDNISCRLYKLANTASGSHLIVLIQTARNWLPHGLHKFPIVCLLGSPCMHPSMCQKHFMSQLNNLFMLKYAWPPNAGNAKIAENVPPYVWRRLANGEFRITTIYCSISTVLQFLQDM